MRKREGRTSLRVELGYAMVEGNKMVIYIR